MRDNFSLLRIANIATVGALLLAILHLPYSYYVFLRWWVTLSASVSFCWAIRWSLWGAAVIFCVIGALFNPFEPVYLKKSLWVMLDFVAAVLMGTAFEDLESAQRNRNPKVTPEFE